MLLYGSISWTLLDRHASRVVSAEMRFLRKILGKTRRYRIRNERVREELGVRSVLETIEERQLKWFGHVNRMEMTVRPGGF